MLFILIIYFVLFSDQPQMMMPMVVPTAATMAAEIPNVSVASTKQTTKTSTKQNGLSSF
jgi:hypothetical protein